jgi:hypothetical protein
MHVAAGALRRIVPLMLSRFGGYLTAVAIFGVIVTLDRGPLSRAVESRKLSTLIIAIGVPMIVILFAEGLPAVIRWVRRRRSTKADRSGEAPSHPIIPSSRSCASDGQLVRAWIGPVVLLLAAGAIFGLERRETHARSVTQARRDALSDNALSGFPPEIGELSNLPSLDLTGNAFAALPPEITKLTISILTLRHNQLTKWPRELEKLTSLTSLHLEENRLPAIPPEIGVLTNLAGLYLEGNPLTALPPEVGKLVQLERLNLRSTGLTKLPPEICGLTSLQELDLQGDRLTELPREIGQLLNLRALHVGGNRLTALPPELGRLSGLRELQLFADPWHPRPDPN